MVSPLVGLGLNIVEVFEGSQGPEVVADIMDGALFHLSFLMGASHVTGKWYGFKGQEECEEGLVEADQGAFALYDSACHIVMDQLPWGSLKEAEGIEKATMQSFLPLGVSKLQIEQSAMAFGDGHAVELAFGVAIGEGAEVAPIDLALGAGRGFKADEGFSVFGLSSDLTQIISQDGDFSLESHWGYALKDNDGRSLLIDLKESVDLFPEGIQEAGPLDGGFFGVWVMEVLGHRFTAEMEIFCDLSKGKSFILQAVDFEDGALVNHDFLPRDLWMS